MIVWTAGDGIDAIDGGAGSDVLDVFGTSGDDLISVVTTGGVKLTKQEEKHGPAHISDST